VEINLSLELMLGREFRKNGGDADESMDFEAKI
jgi:hypothetical protein